MTARWIRSTSARAALARPATGDRTRLRLGAVTHDGLAWLVLAVGVAATAWAARLLLHRVDALAAPPYDLAFFQQVIWNVGDSGRWISGFNEGSFLGIHFSPALVVPAMVERLVWPDVRVLNLFHAVAVGALAPAAFLLLRAALRPARIAGPLAAGLALGIPVWGAMQQVVRADFHPEMVGVVLALLAGWAGLTRRIPAMWLLAVAALLTREDVAYAVGVVGLLVAVRGRSTARRHGFGLAALALAWGALVFLVVMPAIRAGAESDTARYYAWLGGGLGVLAAPFTRTELVLAALTRPAPWFVVLGLIVSAAGLPLLRPRWLALLVPPLVASLLSSHWWQANLLLQYPLILVVPLLAAAAMGGRRAVALGRHLVRRRGPRRLRTRSLNPYGRVALAMLVALPGLIGAFAQASMPPFANEPAFVARPAALDRLQRVSDAVPADAVLVVDDGLMAPLAGRASIVRLSAYPVPPPRGYVIVDRDAWAATVRAAWHHDRVLAGLETSARPLIADDGRFVVWGPAGDVTP